MGGRYGSVAVFGLLTQLPQAQILALPRDEIFSDYCLVSRKLGEIKPILCLSKGLHKFS